MESGGGKKRRAAAAAVATTMLLLLQLMAARTLHDMDTSPVMRLNTIASEFAKPVRGYYCGETCVLIPCTIHALMAAHASTNSACCKKRLLVLVMAASFLALQVIDRCSVSPGRSMCVIRVGRNRRVVW
jgi:hypothetical protein